MKNDRENLDEYATAYQTSFEFDLDNRLILDLYPRLVLENLSHFGSLLELGLGHGISTHAFAGKFLRHVVVEGSAKVIDQFAARYPASQIEVVQAFFEDFSPSEAFDVVVAGFVFEHVDKPELLMSRLRTWVRPGGVIVVAVPNAHSMHRRIGFHAGLLSDLEDLSPGDLQLGHKRLYTMDSLVKLFQGVGLPTPKVMGLFLKPFTTAQLQRLGLSENVLDAMCKVGQSLPELCCAMLAIGDA